MMRTGTPREAYGLNRPGFVLLVAMMMVVAAGQIAEASSLQHRPSESPRLVLSARRVLIDERVRISVLGLAAGELVQLRLTIGAGGQTLVNGRTWTSQADFRADQRGRVRAATDAPVAGSYSGVDSMGLFWSARSTAELASPVRQAWTEQVHLTVVVGGRDVAATDLVRYFLRPGATATPVRASGLVGTFFEPAGDGHHPAVLVVGGSEGGKTFPELQAASLASHGYAALALAYFDPTRTLPGLPSELSLNRLEYFATALDWLARQSRVDPERIGVHGASRGGELALLLGSRFPQLKTVVASAPSSVVWGGLPNVGQSAWSEDGQPVPFLIPKITAGRSPFDWYVDALATPAAQRAAIAVERINGPALLLNGANDELWPSAEMTDQITARLQAHRHPYPDEHLAYPGNGHVIQLPNEPTTQLTPPGIPNGGNAVDSAHAARDAWTQTLRFLNDNLTCAFRTSTGSIEQLVDILSHRTCDPAHRATRRPTDKHEMTNT